MSLIVLPALPPDALSLSLLRHAAFASSNAIYMLAYQDVSLPTLLAAELEASERDLTSSRTVPIECLKVIDTQTGEIVSTAKWHLPYNAPTGETKPKYEGADGVRELAYPEGTNKAILLEYERLAGDMNSQAWKGKRCYRLTSVQTHPSHQGRGAASLLMKWGVERADADGLPCYVNAEEAAYALYRRFGFQDLVEGEIDLARFGGVGVYKTMGMVRWGPREKDGRGSAV